MFLYKLRVQTTFLFNTTYRPVFKMRSSVLFMKSLLFMKSVKCNVKWNVKRRRLHVVWFSLESTTATLCFTALRPAPFRSCSECRTTPRESYCRRRGDLTPTRCCRSCTGYQWSSASPTNWPSWPTRHVRHLCRNISQSTHHDTK